MGHLARTMSFGEWMLDERKFLTVDQLARLRRSVRRRVERAKFRRLQWVEWFLVELALETGLRVMEIAGLTSGDLVVDVLRPGIAVRHGKCGKPRFVRIRKDFARDCKEFLTWKEAVGESIEDDSPVFASPVTGCSFTTRGLQKMFERCCERAAVADHSIHHCRHTYASHLSEASGHNLRLVQRQLGHASMKTTEVYLHVFDKTTDKAVEKLYA